MNKNDSKKRQNVNFSQNINHRHDSVFKCESVMQTRRFSVGEKASIRFHCNFHSMCAICIAVGDDKKNTVKPPSITILFHSTLHSETYNLRKYDDAIPRGEIRREWLIVGRKNPKYYSLISPIRQ